MANTSINIDDLFDQSFFKSPKKIKSNVSFIETALVNGTTEEDIVQAPENTPMLSAAPVNNTIENGPSSTEKKVTNESFTSESVTEKTAEEVVSIEDDKTCWSCCTSKKKPARKNATLDHSNTGRLSYLTKQRLRKVDIEFKGINFGVTQKKEYKPILIELSGCFKRRTLSAVLGPSGAGKSTLLNLLTGYNSSKKFKGQILINGRERNLRAFRKLSCYIMQSDHLHETLSVEESMICSANLKLPQHLENDAKMEVVNDILETLGLHEVRETRTCDLSGGQRKRLSIALELVNNPPVMFFDEPTSGLDSVSSFQCVSLLKSLASEGRTIICTIHQPSAKIFEIFDYLYALADGQCIYRGPVNNLVPFLRQYELECPRYHNPADFIMEVAMDEYGEQVDKLVEAIKSGKSEEFVPEQSSYPPSAVALKQLSYDPDLNSVEKTHHLYHPSTTTNTALSEAGVAASKGRVRTTSRSSEQWYKPRKTSFELDHLFQDDSTFSDLVAESAFATSSFFQFRILFIRTFISILRDKTLTNLRVAAHLVLGILIGLLYLGVGNKADMALYNAGQLFFNTLFLMFSAIVPTVMTFPMELSVFIREHMNYWYSLKAYYLAKTMADIPFQVVYSLIYTVITYFMTSQPYDGIRFLMCLALATQNSLVAQSFGLVVGAATPMEIAVFVGPISGIPFLLFSGFFLAFNSIPIYLRWISYFCFIRYAFEGTLQAVYGMNRPPLQCESGDFCIHAEPNDLLKFLDADEANFYIDFIVLFGFFIVLRFAGYFLLRWRIGSRGK